MKRAAYRPHFITIIASTACLITGAGNLFTQSSQRLPRLPEKPPEVILEPEIEEDFVIPAASTESEAVIKLQGQSVLAPDGKSYLILGITDTPATGCQVTLLGYGKKVACSEVLGWSGGQSPQSPQAAPSPGR